MCVELCVSDFGGRYSAVVTVQLKDLGSNPASAAYRSRDHEEVTLLLFASG